MPIEQLELSQRTYNCLKRSQITKVGQILQMSENELLSLRNFGQKSLVELREKLQEHGVLPEGVGGDGTGSAIGSGVTEESLNGADDATTTRTTRSSQPMRHRVAMRKLGRPTGHRLALIRNLMTDLIRHERLQTTEPKAAELRREVEKLIGTARANDLHARRLVAAKLYDEEVGKNCSPRSCRATRTARAASRARSSSCRGAATARRWPRSSSSRNAEHCRNPPLRLTLGYRGTRYAGWAAQSPSRTRATHRAGHARSCPRPGARPPACASPPPAAPTPACTPTARSSPSRRPRPCPLDGLRRVLRALAARRRLGRRHRRMPRRRFDARRSAAPPLVSLRDLAPRCPVDRAGRAAAWSTREPLDSGGDAPRRAGAARATRFRRAGHADPPAGHRPRGRSSPPTGCSVSQSLLSSRSAPTRS